MPPLWPEIMRYSAPPSTRPDSLGAGDYEHVFNLAKPCPGSS